MRSSTRPPDQLLSLSVLMSQAAAGRGGVISSVEARGLGAQDGDIRALIAAGLWSRLRRGVYADATFVGTAADARHRESAAALLAACGGGTAVSHLSGARLLGLPTPYGDLPHDVEVTRRPPRHGNAPAGARIHVADYDDSDVIRVDGIPVLCGPRLALDCATTMAPPDALAVVDAMLRRGLVTGPELDAARSGAAGGRGASQARRVLELADAGSESWFESASRWWLVAAGLPVPKLQHRFDGDGWSAFVDMWFEEARVVGEADGAAKYAGGLGQRALIEEKRREDRIRERHDVQFVRWMPADIATAARRAALVRRFRTALGRRGGAAESH
jgi:hypothetical protein